jgi:hypothetical protein
MSAPLVDTSLHAVASHFLKSEHIPTLVISAVALVVVVICAGLFVWRFFLIEGQRGPAAEREARELYDRLLAHVRALEAMRLEREMLLRRMFRAAAKWEHPDDMNTLADEFRLAKREQQMLARNCVMALGDRDTAGIIRIDKASSVWERAMEATEQARARRAAGVATGDDIEGVDEEEEALLREASAAATSTRRAKTD